MEEGSYETLTEERTELTEEGERFMQKTRVPTTVFHLEKMICDPLVPVERGTLGIHYIWKRVPLYPDAILYLKRLHITAEQIRPYLELPRTSYTDATWVLKLQQRITADQLRPLMVDKCIHCAVHAILHPKTTNECNCK